EDWKSFWSGKKSKIIYSSSPSFLPTKLLADQGDAKAQYNLGVIYANGLGITQSDAEAFKYFKLAAEQGHADAQYKLGVRYANGRGITQSEQEAIKYYKLAAEQGHADAQCQWTGYYTIRSRSL
ncbi:tetratricopeptide repeat protein, partial [Candidatus Protochlamydia sp. W-9]|uniref:tetratricopeptide repeat protein n=1 Tax=Candidatus Protochlamydia sp. W-9 TaxID=1785087 RepID=UPI002100AFB2